MMAPTMANTSPLKRSLSALGEAEYPALKVTRNEDQASAMPAALPTVHSRPALTDLPLELLSLVTDHLAPHNPYLARPESFTASHFAIGPALRNLASWSQSCKQAQALVAALRKAPQHHAFRQLAAAAELEWHDDGPLAHERIIGRYDLDPELGMAAPYRLTLRIAEARDVAQVAQRLAAHARHVRTLQLCLACRPTPDLTPLVKVFENCVSLRQLSLGGNACIVERYPVAQPGIAGARISR
jgi:hypothetical protein